MDFWEMETISFPPEGSSMTPAHHYSEFRFKIYAPIAFRYFRDLFGIQPDDFMVSYIILSVRGNYCEALELLITSLSLSRLDESTVKNNFSRLNTSYVV